MDVKIIEASSIKDVVKIHITAFDNFFLTTLGPRFLSTYYNAVRRSDEGVLLGCYDDDKLVGFVSGSLHCGGFNGRLIKKNLFQFGLAGVSILFTNPKALLRLKNNLDKEDSSQEDDGNYVELASIGVDPNCQGKGAGALLLKAFEDYCNQKGEKIITLTTDFEGNDSVVRFYKNNGYDVWYDFVTYPNRRMYKMRKFL